METNLNPTGGGRKTPEEEKINEQFNRQFNQQFGMPAGLKELPNATAVLVLGIISIVGCFCYGVIGIITGIVALVLAKEANGLYLQDPSRYTASSFKNMKAGRICAIIGLSVSILAVIFFVLILMIDAGHYSVHPWRRGW